MATFPELSANAALVLLAVACSLLDRQLAALAQAFEREGGFTERLYRVRSETRAASTASTRSTSSPIAPALTPPPTHKSSSTARPV